MNRELDEQVLALRGPKNSVDSSQPYAYSVERERNQHGSIVDVATLFLVNKECPLRCSMCDLWKNTLDAKIEVGEVPKQIRYALNQLHTATSIKLYNSGNFFDTSAIPIQDYDEIIRVCSEFETVIVENHPRFANRHCFRFASELPTELEIAIGLETVHSGVLASLNKQMTVDDFDRCVEKLLDHDIAVRAFILLKPPSLDEEEGIDWALRTIDHAVKRGVRVCSVIPTRSGNGYMDQLQSNHQFVPPRLASLERVLHEAIERTSSRVFVDLWDAEAFGNCSLCIRERVERLNHMNLTQTVLPSIQCDRCAGAGSG